jgi:hypothetical protein
MSESRDIIVIKKATITIKINNKIKFTKINSLTIKID